MPLISDGGQRFSFTPGINENRLIVKRNQLLNEVRLAS
jgi:hypothetical protein